jgi:carboxyl-terminal processing protease
MLQKHISKKLGAVLVALVIIVAGVTIWRYGTSLKPIANGITIVVNQPTPEPPKGVDLTPLWKTWQLIQERSVERTKLDQQKLLEGAIKGLVESLNDPYSAFLTPKEEAEFEESISGSFEGIGIEIGIRNNALTVIAPIAGTPAEKAGLKAGDVILAINKEPTEGMSLEKAVSKIRGKRGTVVTLTIMRKSWKEPQEISITRATIKIPSVTLEFPERGIALLKIHNFHARQIFELRSASRHILRSGITRIILDLRNNPGGFLDYAVETAGWFLKRGSVVLKIDEGKGPEICDSCMASGNAAFADTKFKIVVLVNEGSASAAEILAGALRDNLHVPLIGTKTFGKGSVQELLPVNGAGSLKLTVAKWLTPNGTDISKEGIVPDIIVENPEAKDDKEVEDLQLKRALEVIKSL